MKIVVALCVEIGYCWIVFLKLVSNIAYNRPQRELDVVTDLGNTLSAGPFCVVVQ